MEEEEPSSPMEFDWDAIDAELEEGADGNNVRSDSPPTVIPDLTSQETDDELQRPQLQRDASEDRAGYCSDEERRRANPAGSMAIFKDVVKDAVEHAVPSRQRIFPSDPAKKYSADTEKFSGLRIKDRTLSAADINNTLSDLRFVRLQSIKMAMTCAKLTGSWATVGVIVEKGMPKTSAKGKNFGILKLGTLENSSLSLFLFGGAYTNHWKEPLGSVIAVLNADVRPDTKSKEPSLSVFKSDQVMKLGTSVDYRVCSGRRKDGSPCTMILNKQLQGQFCHYHASAAQKEFRTARPELHGGKLAIVGAGIRTGYPPKALPGPMKDEVFRGPLKRITSSELKGLLSNAEKMPTKGYSQGKRFLEVMAERPSGTKVIATKGVKRRKSPDANVNKRTPLPAKQMKTRSPGMKHIPDLPSFEGKLKSKGTVMEIDILDDLSD